MQRSPGDEGRESTLQDVGDIRGAGTVQRSAEPLYASGGTTQSPNALSHTSPSCSHTFHTLESRVLLPSFKG